jgi:transposase
MQRLGMIRGHSLHKGMLTSKEGEGSVHHGKDEFARGSCRINGIESFWGFAKNRLTKFKRLRKEKFHLYLKERELEFDHRCKDLYAELLREFRNRPLR